MRRSVVLPPFVGLTMVLLSIPTAVSAAPFGTTDGVPYTLSCGVGAPLVLHGAVPATVSPGRPFELEDVFLEYTNPIGTATYAGIELTIPAPDGVTGPDIALSIPGAVTLDRGETYRSPAVSGAYVATAAVGSNVEFRPSRLRIDSASTAGGSSLACDIDPGAGPFAATTVVDGDLQTQLHRRTGGLFAGGSSYVYTDGASDGGCNAQATYDGRYHPEGHPRRTGTYHMDLCMTSDPSNQNFAAKGTFSLRTIGRAEVRGTVSGVVGAPTGGTADVLLSLTITGGSKRFEGAAGSIAVAGTSLFDLQSQTTEDEGQLFATVVPDHG